EHRDSTRRRRSADRVELRLAFSLEPLRPFALAARRRMRSIQCLKLLRCQCQRDGVLLYMRYGTGFGNCNDVTAADSPGQHNSGTPLRLCDAANTHPAVPFLAVCRSANANGL